jgi:uncharacterized small protein (DUF1192 family)
VFIRPRSGVNLAGKLIPVVDTPGPAVNVIAMDLDELFPGKPDDPLKLLTKQDLDPFSVDELEARIAALEAEIARARAKIDQAVSFRASADAIFRK